MGDKINAGIYCLSPAVLDRIEMRPTSIEKETFPLICRDGKLFAFTLPGYWMDVGQPKDYLTGTPPHPQKLRRRALLTCALKCRAGNHRIVLPMCQSMSDTSACFTPTPMPAVRPMLALFAVHSHFHTIGAAQAVS